MNSDKYIYNAGVVDATDIIVKRMQAIVNRPMGEAAPCAVEVLAALVSDILALRK